MQSPRRHVENRARVRAFSIAEVIIVTVVMAVIGAIAFPRYASFVARQHVDSVTRRISSDLALAQRRARFTGTSQTVSFDTVANAYTLVGMQDLDHPSETYTVSLGDAPYEATIVSVSFSGAAQISFNGYGAPDSGGTVVVSCGPWTKQLQVDAATGRTTVSDVVVVEEPGGGGQIEQPPELG